MLFNKSSRSSEGDFFNLLIDRTKKIAEQSNLDVFWYDEKKQAGATFAERFSNAFQEIFDKGYEKVISIGNDCPYLTSFIIEDAHAKILKNDVVLGPSKDGGAYLIGLDRSAFNAENFKALSWQQDALLEDFLAYSFAYEQSVECLEELADVDKLRDLLELISLSPQKFLQFIAYCIKSFSRKIFFIASLTKIQFNKTFFSLRAPPGIA